MTDIISMRPCPACGEDWVREDTELVCDKCTPALNVDLAVHDLIRGVSELEREAPVEVRARIDLLNSVYSKLGEIIKKATPRKEKDDVDAT